MGTLENSESRTPVLLNPVESYFWKFETDLSGAFRVSILLNCDGFVESQFLSTALGNLQRRHPKLRALIAPGRDGALRYHFRPEPPAIPFEMTDFGDEEFPWREETHRILHMGLPQAGPHARLAAFRSKLRNKSQFILTMTHAIADGLSAIMVMDDLMTEYANAELDPSSEASSSLPLIVAQGARSTGGLRGRVRLVRRFLKVKRQEKLGQAKLPVSHGVTPHSQWMHWIFSEKTTLEFIRRCRREQTSLDSAVVAAVYCGLMDCLPVPEAVFTLQLPFSVRGYLKSVGGPVTDRDLGCFVTNMNAFLEVQRQPDYWELARRAHNEIQGFVQEGGPSFGYNIAFKIYGGCLAVRRWLSRPEPKFEFSAFQRPTLLATSYGVVDLKSTYGSLRPRGCTLVYKNDVAGPSLVMEALLLGKELNIGFAAADLEPAFWERLHEATHRHLRAAGLQPAT